LHDGVTDWLTNVPQVYNADSLGYRPDLVGHEVTEWKDLIDPKFKGKAAILDVPAIGIMDAALCFESAGLDYLWQQRQHDLHQAHAVAPAAIAFLAALQVDRRIDTRNLLDPDGGDGGRPHRLDHDLAGGHQLHRLVEGGPGGAELTRFLQLDQLVAGEIDLLLGI
jgi:hypothetical protein